MPIVEFINDSPISGRIGSHSRYFPDEWCNRLCRGHLDSSPSEKKRQSFDEICARFSPSFRFFFLERFGSCMESWHAAKMNFTRSVAVSSIVGHILGIGDRHLGNILIHQGTGEVVHIDFGIVFEQGKVCVTTNFWLSISCERARFNLTVLCLYPFFFFFEVTSNSRVSAFSFDKKYCRRNGSLWNRGFIC
jgi:hypothetical protein